MTPPPAATAAPRAAAGRRLNTRPAGRIPRRVSGPARPRAARLAAGGLTLPRPIDVRLPRPSARALTGATRRAWGLLRGRGLIVVLAGALLGLVFLQVSLLKLNTQITQNVERASALERDNAGKRGIISGLDAGRRIQDVAGQLGMVMPGAGAVCYLDARRGGACSGGDPAAAVSAVDPAADTAPPATPADAAVAADPQQAAPAADPAATAAPQAQTAPAADPQTAAPQQTAPVTQAPAATAPPAAATPAPAAAPTDQQAVATGGTSAGA